MVLHIHTTSILQYNVLFVNQKNSYAYLHKKSPFSFCSLLLRMNELIRCVRGRAGEHPLVCVRRFHNETGCSFTRSSTDVSFSSNFSSPVLGLGRVRAIKIVASFQVLITDSNTYSRVSRTLPKRNTSFEMMESHRYGRMRSREWCLMNM